MGYFLRPARGKETRDEIRKFDRPGRPSFQAHQFDVALGSASYKELDRLSPEACASIYGSKSLTDHVERLLFGWLEQTETEPKLTWVF